MNTNLKKDAANLATILKKVSEQGAEYLDGIAERPTSTTATIQKEHTLSEQGIGTLATLENFNERFEPLMVASSGPKYWGFVTGGSTPAAIAGDWLTTIYDQNTQAEKGSGDNSAQIELETIQLLLDLFDLPKDYLGGFVTGATLSNFTSLAVARQWLGKQKGYDIAKEGSIAGLKFLTATPHSSALKSMAMLGVGSNNFTKIRVLEGNREAMDTKDLEQKIIALNGEPFVLISSGGTVNTVDFDDFQAISELKKQYSFWWHIDAAFGGFAACSPIYRHLVKGWENADSITIDCHKWLNVPYESAVYFIKDQHRNLQVETFQNSNAPYLGDPLENFTYLNFLPENSRRLKALPAWFSLKAYGKKGYRDIVENNIENAKQFGDYIDKDSAFELLAQVRLNTVCFTLEGAENQEKVILFLKSLNDTGKVFMTPTVYNGKKAIRAAFVNWRTNSTDINDVTQLMKGLADKL
ncbi:pyridoxal phosphate-dependent decarboxylase family protein [Flavobacterium wongokense]|uniref:pyridoxal phosphate-dependent decarboxylase family protein n=1 Tax=Flavobacterium wongokense TaxID=2910674 RepID=UPI001F2E588D|nr:pyridoxal-dependent decarboxylase [Flavobacterium sp. WG47]MCF6132790.1 pyridoxal-dependent decarboxylase [Flavobacterium sp. WG47]